MKKITSLPMLFFVFFVGISSSSFAADMYLKFTGVNGESKIVSCPDATCVISDLAVGEYKVEQTDKDGKAISNPVVLSHEVKSPRDAASGLATGKRTHKPMKMITDSTGVFTLSITELNTVVAVQDHNSSRSNKSR
ncbi:MAG: hypothetical protein IPK77_17010 [Cellvibrio sp.]|nr:hypothetical protein [Cellvibrio sp.]